MDKKQVIIWGKGFGMEDTLIFKNCTNVQTSAEHGGSIHFQYHGVKTKVISQAIFKISDIAGWAVGDIVSEEK